MSLERVGDWMVASATQDPAALDAVECDAPARPVSRLTVAAATIRES
jgi:hypothetical protein